MQYYGRGPFQLSWNFNYGPFSQSVNSGLKAKDAFLQDPDQIHKTGFLAFTSAIWFYMTPATPKPSMHEVVTKLYVPSAHDTSVGLNNSFGATIRIINGILECDKGTETPYAQNRIDYYTQLLTYFDHPQETDLGCANMQDFSDSSSSNYNQHFVAGDSTNTCKVTSEVTQYSYFRNDDYKRCVCDTWAPGDESCLASSQSTISFL